MQNVYVSPRLLDDGTPALVRMPEQGYARLPAQGAWVPQDEYWARRLRDGDVLAGEPHVEPEQDHEPEPDAAPPAIEPAAPPETADAPQA